MTRPFDRHLDSRELAGLVSPHEVTVAGSGLLSEETLADAQSHVASCRGCALKVETYRAIQNDLSSLRQPAAMPPGPECSTEGEWLKVGAGLLSKTEITERMKHASQCGYCGPLLRNAAATMEEEASAGEELMLSSLSSARPEWQSRVAQTLNTVSRPKKISHWLASLRSVRSSWQLPASAAAVVAFAAITTYFGIRLLRGPSVDQLLAQAYTERRTLEVRIPHAKYAPLRVNREAGSSNLERPPALLKAEYLIGERLQKSPNDPVWLDARARADLLDGNYESAIKTLKRALLTKPGSVALLTDLGSAYYARGQSSPAGRDYGNAIEAFGLALQEKPNDPIALFNSALACEQFFLYYQASADWKRYLQQDPRGEWAQQAREHLDNVNRIIEKREHERTHSLLRPRDFPLAGASSNPEVVSEIERRPEIYQQLAVRSWLPEALGLPGRGPESPADARRALAGLAQILADRHADNWLADFLKGSANPLQKEAIRKLLASDEAVRSGRYGLGLQLARQSGEDFTRARNRAGMLRAGLAVMVAEGFALQYSGCLKAASGMVPLLTGSSYHWLQAASLIEQGDCLTGAAQVRQAMASLQKGWELAEHSNYLELQLRATGFRASVLATVSSDQGIGSVRSGLATFWQSDVSDKPGENLYACLFDVSDVFQWPFVNQFALEELLHRFPSSDPLDQAVQRQFLAGAQERAGDHSAARETLQSAVAHLASLPTDGAVALREAEIAVDLAQLQLNLNDAQGAIALLAPWRQEVENAGPGRSQAEYFKTLGEAYLRLGKESEAQPFLERALAVRQTGLGSLQQEVDRLAWSRAKVELYRDLLEAALKSSSPSQALALWESYKGSSLRPSANPSLRNPGVPAGAPRRETAVISYVLLRTSVTVFVARGGVVHVHAFGRPPELEQKVSQFVNLCSDPSSDMNLIDEEGRQLYQILVAPLESDIASASALRIETDGIVDQVPFSLLRKQAGTYLQDLFQISFSPGAWFGRQPRPDSRSEALSRAGAALVVVSPGGAHSTLAPLPGAEQEGSEVASVFKKAVLISGPEISREEVLAKLRDAHFFHFAGHAVPGADGVSLVLGSESLLRSNDIAGLQLPALELAVLSACETANGEEGTSTDLNSMARTLVAAGVPNVVASRWRVDSSVTRELMRVFYSGVLSGKSPAEALRTASEAVRNDPAYRHPYYWASFAVYGTS